MIKKILLILLVINTAHALVASGTSTVSNINGLNEIGFMFNTGQVTGNNGDFYFYNNALWTNGPGGIKDQGLTDFNKLKSCDLTGYVKSNVPVLEAHTYCIKTSEGSYAKMIASNVSSNGFSFSWAHQRDGTELFSQASQAVPVDINYALVIIIIILAVLLIIVWKFR